MPRERPPSTVGEVTLEDSRGDILRKARTSTQTVVAAAAQAAGVSAAEYERMEESGKPAAGCRFAELGARLTLAGAKLTRIAEGRLPKPVAHPGGVEPRVIPTPGEGTAVPPQSGWEAVQTGGGWLETK